MTEQNGLSHLITRLFISVVTGFLLVAVYTNVVESFQLGQATLIRHGAVLPAVCADNQGFFIKDSIGPFYCHPANTWKALVVSAGTSALLSGSIVMITSGTCGSLVEVSALSGVTLEGTVASNGNVGTTGGSDNITPAGTVSQPTFTGNVGTTSGNSTTINVTTGAVAVAANGHTHTITPTGTVSQPTFSGNSFDNRSSFTRVIFCKEP